MQPSFSQRSDEDSVLVWDVPVRIMHWSLAGAVALAWTTQQLPGDWFEMHVACGYIALVIACTRIVWGFVGTRHARFTNFVRGPAAILRYSRSLFHAGSEKYAGHNPLGAMMVLLLLGLVVAQATTGLFANDQVSNVGPLFGCVGASKSDYLSGIHRMLSTAILLIVLLHVMAAVGYLLFKRTNLIQPMITGYKPATSVALGSGIAVSRIWLASLIAGLLSLALAVMVHNAPPASLAL